jgi:hypothetical protein
MNVRFNKEPPLSNKKLMEDEQMSEIQLKTLSDIDLC